MKILYVGYQKNAYSGGDYIMKRNCRLLKSYFGEDNIIPLNVYSSVRYLHKSLNKVISALKEAHYDYVFFDNSQMCYCPGWFTRKYKTIIFFHNVEHDYYQDFLASNATLRKRIRYYLADILERSACKRAYKTIALNERDSLRLKELYGRGADELWPTSFEDRYQPEKQSVSKTEAEKFLLFVGVDFFGNTDGLFWFIENCMPKIDIPLKVVGTGMERYRDRNTDKVEFVGWVEDLDAYYRNCLVLVLPIISGSGMKTKTCEAMMYGKDVIGTDEAFEGYGDVECIGYCRCNSAEEFIKAIHEYSQAEKPSFNSMARNYYLQNFSDEALLKKTASFLQNL